MISELTKYFSKSTVCHMSPNAFSVGCRRSISPVARCSFVCVEAISSHSTGASITNSTSQVSASSARAFTRLRVRGDIARPVMPPLLPGRGGTIRHHASTHTNIASVSSTDAAAPNPNRLFWNDWRTIRVIIRSASGPGVEPSITTGIAYW